MLVIKKYWFIRICIIVITITVLIMFFNYYKFRESESINILTRTKVIVLDSEHKVENKEVRHITNSNRMWFYV